MADRDSLSYRVTARYRTFLDRQQEYHARRGHADPALAALTDLSSVIFSLNEFVYMN